jgi:hypothetical protein
MSFTPTVSQYHDALAAAMGGFRGQVLTKAQIDAALIAALPDPQQLQWIFPSDHCSNHTNEGACECAKTNRAIFERVEWGKYRVL